jgi:hypothetical protein
VCRGPVKIEAANTLKEAMLRFSDVNDGRGNEGYQEVEEELKTESE